MSSAEFRFELLYQRTETTNRARSNTPAVQHMPIKAPLLKVFGPGTGVGGVGKALDPVVRTVELRRVVFTAFCATKI